MTPKIGILTAINNEVTVSMLGAYGRVIEKSGGLPLVLPYVEDEKIIDEFIDTCDGFMFTGGADIEPALYGEDKKSTCGENQLYRDKLEMTVFRKIYEKDKPILAICRGEQLSNVALGGTLYQDIPSEYETDILHVRKDDIYAPSHDVFIVEDSPLYNIVKKDVIVGNSYHHQAIKDLSSELEIMARASDGMIEAVWAPKKRYLRGYQWHPERLFDIDGDNKKIIEDFIKESSKSDK